MGIFDKNKFVTGVFGNPVRNIFDTGPSLSEKLDMLFTDVEVEGKKQGYKKAAAEYKKAFQAIENEYNNAKKVIEYQKNAYGSQVDILIEKLESLEKQKDNLKKQVERKAKAVSEKYDIPESQVKGSLAAGAMLIGGPMSDFSILGMIYKHKERKLHEAEQRGYIEAKELYEAKIEKLKSELSALKEKGNAEIKKLLNLIDEILGEIVDEQMKIAELKILL